MAKKKFIAKTFRLPVEVVQEITLSASRESITQSEYITRVFSENKRLKMQHLFYDNASKMSVDKEYLVEQEELAEADFL